MNSPLPPIQKPRKICVPASVALSWTPDPNYIYQEKMDGRFELRTVEGQGENLETTIAGELMPDGTYWAFDCVMLYGIDIRHHPYSDRLTHLGEIVAHFPRHLISEVRLLPTLNYQPSTLNDIWSRGGEGIVRKRLDSPWGTPMEACKRLETFYCIVTAMGHTQSVQISRIVHFGELRESDPSGFEQEHFYQCIETQSCGSIKLGGGKCDRVRVGSILKVEGFGLTAAGQIREPRPCKDTPTSWLVKY